MKIKRIALIFIITLMGISAQAQTAKKQELVSQRVADAISKGKFYMKLSGMFDHEDEEDGNINMMLEMRIAVKDDVTMMRMPKMQQVSLVVDGYTYQLNEASKTYTPIPPQGVEPDFDFGKLNFQSQGVCKLNGADYYYDRYRCNSGQTITFYYNSNKVAAIDLGLKDVGMGVMNLLEFDTRIPDDMFFCLTPEWKRGGATTGMEALGIDQDAMMAEAMKNINPEDLPEGFDISQLMKGGGINTEAIMQQALSEIDPSELPEGMSINDIMSMAGAAGSNSSDLNQIKGIMGGLEQDSETVRKMLRMQGVPEEQINTMISNMFPDPNMTKELISGMEQQQARTQAVNNAPEPPKCSTPWHDPSQSCSLAAGSNLGAISVSGSKPNSPYIYISDLSAPTQVATYSKEVTDEGVWRAFNALVKETEGMSDDEATTYLMEHAGAMPTLADMRFVNGEVIERAVAICMLAPSALSYNNAGLLFFMNKDTQNALTYYQAAERCDKDSPTILANIAECFLELGDKAAARRYAERAVALAPDFGLAWQIITTLNLAEKRYAEAAETLFRSAATHFSEITAQQFFSLWLVVQEGSAYVCQGIDQYRLFHNIFSEKNLELLTKATQSGYSKQEGLDIPANQVDMPWLVQNGNLHLTYTSMDKRFKEADKEIKSWLERNDQLEKDNIDIPLMMAMGMGNYQAELEGMKQNVQNYTGFNISLPDIPTTDLYAMASQQARGSYQGRYLLDACQYWCLKLWMEYYEGLYDYLNGGWYCEEKNIGKKSAAAIEKEEYEKVQEGVRNALLERALWVQAADHQACVEARNDCHERARSELESLRCEEEYLRCMIHANVKYCRAYNQYLGKWLETPKMFWEKYEQPLLEEYWLRMNALVAYCESTDLQEYYLNEVAYFINSKWIDDVDTAVRFGMDAELVWSDQVRSLEAQLDEVIAEINYLDQPKIEVIEKSGGELKNYGEKERNDLGFGIPLPWGEVGYRSNGEQYGFFFDNEATGESTFWGEDDSTEVLETYDCLASKPSPDDPKGYAETIGKWAAQDGTKKVVDAAAKGLGLGGVSALAPVNKSSSTRQRKITTDSKGNISSSEISYTDKRTIGVDALNMTKTRQRIRTGNAVRTVNHVQYNFLGIISVYETY